MRALSFLALSGCLLGADPFKGADTVPVLEGNPELVFPELGAEVPVVGEGVTVRVRLATRAPIDPSTTLVTLDGFALTLEEGADPTRTVWARTLDGTEGSSPKTVTGVLRDPFGREARFASPVLLETDFLAPTAGCALSPAVAPSDAPIRFSFTPSEPLRAPPVLGAPPGLIVGPISETGQGYAWTLRGQAGVSLDPYVLTLSAEDRAGNVSADEALCSEVARSGVMLGRAPALPDGVEPVVTLSPGVILDGVPWGRVGATVRVVLPTTEALDEATSVVSISGVALSRVDAETWEVTLDGDEGEGLKTLDARLYDAAGNELRVVRNAVAGFDFTAPSATCTVTPEVARADESILLRVSPTEPLSQAEASSPDVGVAALVQVGSRWEGALTPPAAVNTGYTVAVTLTDRVGNQASGEAVCPSADRSGVVYGVPPTLDRPAELAVVSGPSVVEPGAVARVGTGAVLAVTLDTTLAVDTEASSVQLGELALGWDQASATWRRTVVAGDADGRKALRATLVDAVGNVLAVDRPDLAVVVDQTPPSGGCVLSPTTLRVGASGVFTVRANELLGALQVGSDAPVVQLVARAPEGLVQRYDITPAPDVAADFILSVTATDLVGNGSAALCTAEETAGDVRTVVPSLGAPPAVQVQGVDRRIDGVPWARAGEVLEVVLDPIVAPVGALDLALTEVTLGGAPLSSTDGLTWARTIDGTEGEGLRELVVSIADAAGNRSRLSWQGAAGIDTVPPTAVCLLAPDVANARAAAAGIELLVFLSEPLDAAGVGVAPSGPVEVLSETGDDGERLFTLGATVSDVDALYTLAVDGRDLVGNEAVAGALCGELLAGEIRGRLPRSLSRPAITVRPDLSAWLDGQSLPVVGVGGVVEVTLATEAPIAPAASAMWLGGVSLAHDTGDRWTHQADGTEGQGTRGLQVLLVDDVGNQATELWPLAVGFDFLPPTLVGSDASRAPAFAPADDGSGLLYLTDTDPLTGAPVALTVTVSADEPLASAVLSLDGPGAPSPPTPTLSDASATWVFPDLTGFAAGAHTLRVTLGDAAGNLSPSLRLLDALVVDRTGPADPPGVGVADRVRLVRRPWGADDADGAVVADVVGLPGAASPDVLVVARPAGGGAFAAHGLSGPNGAFLLRAPGDALVDADVAMTDRAGNLSSWARVRDGRAVVGFGPGAPLTPSAAVRHAEVRDVPATVAVPASPEDGAALAFEDADTWQTDGLAVWTSFAAPVGPAPKGRVGARMAFDAERGVSVMYGGHRNSQYQSCWVGTPSTLTQESLVCNDTWAWDGTAWVLLGGGLVARDHAMAFDAVRGEVVSVGYRQPFGGGNTRLDLWDGQAWRNVVPGIGTWSGGARPSSRISVGLAFDPVRGETLLFGGLSNVNSGVFFADTWAWNGTSWTQRATSGPPGRRSGAMAYDEARGAMVLYGGTDSNYAVLDDTWRWNGFSWTQAFPAHTPAATTFDMTYDAVREEVLLHGDTGTWTWDGLDWTQRAAPGAGVPPAGHALVFDRAREVAVLFDGVSASASAGEIWEWDGVQWRPRASAGGLTPRDGAAAAWFEGGGHVVLSGGRVAGIPSSDLWTWDGAAWSAVAGATAPGPREGQTLTAAADGMSLLDVGGVSGASYRGDLWSWNGTTWAALTPATALPPRAWHAAALTDAGHLVVSGGEDAAGPRGDTWRFDGVDWVQLGGPQPSPRRRAAMVADPAEGRLVLFGGEDNVGLLGDTWVLEGGAWRALAPGGPTPRADHAMTYDEGVGRVVLHGGRGAGGTLDDTWELVGDAWLPLGVRTPVTGSPGRQGHVLVYDPARDTVLAAAGRDGVAVRNDVIELDRARDRGPSQQVAAALGPGLAPPDAAVVGVEVRWVAGGRGFDAVGSVPGVSLLVWDQGGWTAVAQHGAASPAPLCWLLRSGMDVEAESGCAVTTDAAMLQRLLPALPGSVHVAARPVAPNGDGDPSVPARNYASLQTDLVEVVVRTRTPPP